MDDGPGEDSGVSAARWTPAGEAELRLTVRGAAMHSSGTSTNVNVIGIGMNGLCIVHVDRCFTLPLRPRYIDAA